LNGSVYDAAWFQLWHSAERGVDLVLRNQPWAKVLVNSEDIHFRREESGLSLGISHPSDVEDRKRRELAAYRKAHAVICTSEEDGRSLDAEGGIARRFTIPLVVTERPRSSGPRATELLFLGYFPHAPNPDGLLWFAREIWPIIHGATPDAKLTVVGSNPPDEVRDLAGIDGVDVVGYVPDVAPYLDRAALMVAPLRFGAGVKTKVVEAMASGLPVVTTSVGAQGLEVTPGEHLMLADEPGAFARAVVELLGEPGRAERIGRAGRAAVSATCSPDAVAFRLEAMLASILEGPPPAIPPGDWWVRWVRSQAREARWRLGRLRRSILRSGGAASSGT